jgi:hypothetical protein
LFFISEPRLSISLLGVFMPGFIGVTALRITSPSKWRLGLGMILGWLTFFLAQRLSKSSRNRIHGLSPYTTQIGAVLLRGICRERSVLLTASCPRGVWEVADGVAASETPHGVPVRASLRWGTPFRNI